MGRHLRLWWLVPTMVVMTTRLPEVRGQEEATAVVTSPWDLCHWFGTCSIRRRVISSRADGGDDSATGGIDPGYKAASSAVVVEAADHGHGSWIEFTHLGNGQVYLFGVPSGGGGGQALSSVNWHDANAFCLSRGAHLVQFSTALESDTLRSFASRHRSSPGDVANWWIGLRLHEDGDGDHGGWRWTPSGRPAASDAFSHWNAWTGEPNGGRKEQCAVLWWQARSRYAWADWNCEAVDDSTGRPFRPLCQKARGGSGHRGGRPASAPGQIPTTDTSDPAEESGPVEACLESDVWLSPSDVSDVSVDFRTIVGVSAADDCRIICKQAAGCHVWTWRGKAECTLFHHGVNRGGVDKMVLRRRAIPGSASGSASEDCGPDHGEDPQQEPTQGAAPSPGGGGRVPDPVSETEEGPRGRRRRGPYCLDLDVVYAADDDGDEEVPAGSGSGWTCRDECRSLDQCEFFSYSALNASCRLITSSTSSTVVPAVELGAVSGSVLDGCGEADPETFTDCECMTVEMLDDGEVALVGTGVAGDGGDADCSDCVPCPEDQGTRCFMTHHS